MYPMLTYWLMISAISATIILLPTIIASTMKKWSNKNSSFECGMNLNSMPRKPFSLRFFLLMILFIIFDIEIALILATPMLMPWASPTISFLMMFAGALTSGVIYEWFEGSLNWKA